MRLILVALFFVACGNITAVAESKPSAAPTVPLEAFAAMPSFSNARFSPSGNKVAFMTTLEGRRQIMVLDLKTNGSVVIPPNEDAELSYFNWGNEDVLLFTFAVTRKRHQGSHLLTESKLFSFNVKTHKYVWLGKPKKAHNSLRNKGTASYGENMIHRLPDDPDHILIQFTESADIWPGVYKVNINSGRRTKVKTGKRGILGWYADQEGNVRLGSGYYRTGRSLSSEKFVATLFDKKGKETNLTKTDWFEKYSLIDFTSDPNVVYVQAKSELGTDGLYTLNLQTGEVLETLFEHPVVDIDDTVRHPETGQVVGVSYTVDTYQVKYFDKELSRIQRSLKKALQQDVYITGKVKGKETYAVFASSLNNPGEYYIYDREAGSLNMLAPLYPDIYPEDMPATQTVDIMTRDKANIPAYITLPLGAQKGDKLPTVILPHGGPHARDTADWDFWSQFYANRGYAVMRPNFRGSTGYGDNFYKAGRNKWGGLMQDDVTDATLWMISEGYSDPDRICIVGASYGGYAAMFAPIKEPNLYKCAVSVNGVPDIPRMKQSDRSFLGFSDWIGYMGLEGEPDETVSPYHRADEINVPLLLMSSVDDSRVPYKMSTRMQSRMKSLGKDSRYIQINDGGHSMLTKAARITLLSETEKFLAEHIGR